MSFGIWYVRSLHRAKSLSTVARELSMNKLDLLDIQRDYGKSREFYFLL
jgi:hypothetical protein